MGKREADDGPESVDEQGRGLRRKQEEGQEQDDEITGVRRPNTASSQSQITIRSALRCSYDREWATELCYI